LVQERQFQLEAEKCAEVASAEKMYRLRLEKLIIEWAASLVQARVLEIGCLDVAHL
jgi:hypothetical protein